MRNITPQRRYTFPGYARSRLPHKRLQNSGRPSGKDDGGSTRDEERTKWRRPRSELKLQSSGGDE